MKFEIKKSVIMKKKTRLFFRNFLEIHNKRLDNNRPGLKISKKIKLKIRKIKNRKGIEIVLTE